MKNMLAAPAGSSSIAGRLCLVVFAAACGHAAGAEREPDTAEPARASARVPERPLADRGEHMLADFATAIDARDAIIDGDLARARSLTAWIAGHDYAGVLPPRWMPWVTSMQEEAGRAAAAEDLETAAFAIASMARECGDCHFNFEGGPVLPELEDQGAPPPGPEPLDVRMERHEYAADDMWLGLVVPSTDTWLRGAHSLADEPPLAPAQDGRPLAPSVAGEVAHIQDLGKRAIGATRVEERVKLYGEFLAACAGCHAAHR